ncbi:NAD(P)H-quinone oxidoreductase subunit U, chloroplastic [Gastrolobium bilobum]|uniref:NAD(P)H-quinone oxidoreductase subunit U, chloroplastic n=1 Tax=Gastrolobium bilobum TaxID=150636 RepID=UPI002AB15CB4|nr:NAD(P)H-quinone oxidoreductase subunit U, chloroplastic [Gastrolobium bilobum]
MAVSSTTATVCIPGKNVSPTPAPKFGFSTTISFTVKPRRLCIRSSSSDVSADTTDAEVVDSESSIEVPKEPPSLISALNVERALRGIPITDADHYGRLGIPRGCPFDKVAVAYNNKVRELESQDLEEEELKQKLALLKESYTILSSEQERRIYDWSLARSQITDKYVWPFEVDITQIPKGDPPPQEPEDVGPTILVGYFILGWIILSIVLSIGLNL